jgi:hypothetical protein
MLDSNIECAQSTCSDASMASISTDFSDISDCSISSSRNTRSSCTSSVRTSSRVQIPTSESKEVACERCGKNFARLRQHQKSCKILLLYTTYFVYGKLEKPWVKHIVLHNSYETTDD